MTDRLFRVAVWFKGVDGALELLAALAVLLVPGGEIQRVVAAVVARDLLGPPGDLVARRATAGAAALAADGVPVALYLAAHGAVKLALVVALLHRRVRAYPVAVVVLALFVAVELERAVRTGSALLAVLAALDVLVIVLVVREYRALRRVREAPG